MGKIILSKLDDATLAEVQRRADRHGRTLEDELCSIVAHAVRPDRTALVEQLRREQDELARKYGIFPDSTPLIREWRDK